MTFHIYLLYSLCLFMIFEQNSLKSRTPHQKFLCFFLKTIISVICAICNNKSECKPNLTELKLIYLWQHFIKNEGVISKVVFSNDTILKTKQILSPGINSFYNLTVFCKQGLKNCILPTHIIAAFLSSAVTIILVLMPTMPRKLKTWGFI